MSSRLIEGEKIGEIRGKREVALNLLKIGISLEDIVKSTGLTSDEIRFMQEK